MSGSRNPPVTAPLSATDWHVLVALVEEDLHGYGIMKAVQKDSGGSVTAEIGSLYRILSRLMSQELVDEVDQPKGAPTDTRGRARRYYRLTKQGRLAVQQESSRLSRALELARARHLVPGSGK